MITLIYHCSSLTFLTLALCAWKLFVINLILLVAFSAMIHDCGGIFTHYRVPYTFLNFTVIWLVCPGLEWLSSLCWLGSRLFLICGRWGCLYFELVFIPTVKTFIWGFDVIWTWFLSYIGNLGWVPKFTCLILVYHSLFQVEVVIMGHKLVFIKLNSVCVCMPVCVSVSVSQWSVRKMCISIIMPLFLRQLLNSSICQSVSSVCLLISQSVT